MTNSYPFDTHPCWSSYREGITPRIHLPVASVCNVKCFFCDHAIGSSCHTAKPGAARRIMTPFEASKRALKEIQKRNGSLLVAISGPGEPLANDATFTTLKKIREIEPDCKFCLSTNGLLVAPSISDLVELGIDTISISISAIKPETASRIYEWARIDGELEYGLEMGSKLIKRQLDGVAEASRNGIFVKVNSILIPGLNDLELPLVAREIAKRGAALQNVVPLIPYANMEDRRKPSPDELEIVRKAASVYIPQFFHCRQCRSDVIGVPGNDQLL
ncbi:MAG: radical SAM protein [Candidatus Thorarchaeota archaeon]